MTPLRPLKQDAKIGDPDLQLGARLLTSTGPLPKSEARKRRVWNALGAGRPSRVGFRLTAVRVAFASVLFAAASSAAVGRYYIERRAEAPAPVAVVDVAPKVPAPVKRRPPAAPALEPLAQAEAAPSAPVTPPPRKADAVARRAAGPDKDAELLVEAMRARRAGDSQRVAELVAAYRARQPRGVLQEEALMLSIESAVARRASNAPQLAREYLSRYPQGRFAAQARRALAAAPR